MKKIVLILLMGLALSMVGCSSVSSKFLIGEPVTDDLRQKFDGVWDFGDENIGHIKYLGNGRLRIAGGEWKENRFDLEEMDVILTKCGNKQFVNFHDQEEVNENESDYLFGYCAFIGDDYFLVWLPKTDAFEKAVNDGKIKGKVVKEKSSKSIYLEETPEKICRFLQSQPVELLFDLEDPMIYRRIIREKVEGSPPQPAGKSGTTPCASPPCP
jgi:hypothetical protein